MFNVKDLKNFPAAKTYMLVWNVNNNLNFPLVNNNFRQKKYILCYTVGSSGAFKPFVSSVPAELGMPTTSANECQMHV